MASAISAEPLQKKTQTKKLSNFLLQDWEQKREMQMPHTVETLGAQFIKLAGCLPSESEKMSFANLCEETMRNALDSPSDPLWCFGFIEQAQNAVVIACLIHVQETRGKEVCKWVTDFFKIMKAPNAERLKEWMAICPDKTILPIGGVKWPKSKSEELKEILADEENEDDEAE